MSDITRLSGVSQYGDPLVSDLLEWSCYQFLDWGLLGVGAFTNVNFPSGTYPSGVGSHSVEPYVLRPSRDPRYGVGQIWEGFRSNWVYESGISYSRQPIQISGVYVNNVFRPVNTTGPSGYKINYPEGRVIFNTPIPTGSRVACEFSFKNVRIDMDDAQWFKAVQFDSFNVNDPQFQSPTGSGAWDVLSANRIQLPAVVIGAVPRVNMEGLQMGNLSRMHYQDVVFHILAETKFDRKQLHDIIVNQWQRRIEGVDKKKLANDNHFPLAYDGQINPSGYTYPQMVEPAGSGAYSWRKITWEEVRSAEVPSKPPLFRAVVRATLSVDLP